MIIFPAIDIKDGKCVRLVQGDFSQDTVYDNDPVAVAEKWQNAGAQFIHMVDLDGALHGLGKNRAIVAQVLQKVKIPVQLGGGIRTMNDIESLFHLGVNRVIVGTSAVLDKKFIQEALQLYGDKIVVSLDAKNGMVAIKGWTEVSDQKATDLATDLVRMGLKTIVYTDIAKDGMMAGPNFAELQTLAEAVPCDIIASGGICQVAHIKKLRDMGLYGAIVGKALYTGDIVLQNLWEELC